MCAVIGISSPLLSVILSTKWPRKFRFPSTPAAIAGSSSASAPLQRPPLSTLALALSCGPPASGRLFHPTPHHGPLALHYFSTNMRNGLNERKKKPGSNFASRPQSLAPVNTKAPARTLRLSGCALIYRCACRGKFPCSFCSAPCLPVFSPPQLASLRWPCDPRGPDD